MNGRLRDKCQAGILTCRAIAAAAPGQVVVIVISRTGPAPRCGMCSANGTRTPAQDVLTLGELSINHSEREARWRGNRLMLSQREFGMLAYLARRAGHARSFLDLQRECWGGEVPASRETLHGAIKRLRRKLRDAGADLTIQSVPGFGFRLEVPAANPDRRAASAAGQMPRASR